MNVLLLERDDRERESLRQQLLSRGHVVRAYSSWPQITNALDQPPSPRLALLAWSAQAVDWIQRARVHERGTFLMVVVLIDSDQCAQLANMFEIGANDYLIRPLDRADLAYRLMQFEYRVQGWTRILETRGFDGISHLELAVQHCGDSVEVTDADLRYIYVNPGFTRTFGYTFKEVQGRTPGELLRSGEQPPEFYAAIEDTVGRGGVWRGELSSNSKDGRLLYLDASIVGLQNASGTFDRLVAVKRDITARRLAETAARETAARLQATLHSLSEAVIAVDPQCLVLLVNQVARSLAVIPNDQVVGQHVSDVWRMIDDASGQRLDEPVLTILGHDEAREHGMRMTVIDRRGRHHPVHAKVTAMRDGGDDLIGAVLVLRDMTAQQRAEKALAAEAAAEAANRSKSTFFATVSHELRTPMNGVIGMASMLRETELDDDQQDMLTILEHSAEALLEVIDRILAASRANTDPNDEPVFEPISAIFSVPAQVAKRTEDRRVLIVDDNAINRNVAKRIVRRIGLSCEVACDGWEAIDIMRAQFFDIILMDCHMPGLSGLQATRILREYERGSGRHSTIIALTADQADGNRQACLRAGMDGFLGKPLRMDALAYLLGVP